MGIWFDEIYGNIIYDIPDELTTGDTSTEAWTKIVTAFVKDVERHGLDLNYVLDGKISYSIESKIGAEPEQGEVAGMMKCTPYSIRKVIMERLLKS